MNTTKRGGMAFPRKGTLVVGLMGVLAASLAISGLVGHAAQRGATADAAQPVTGEELAQQMGLTLLPAKPEECMNFVEVDDPAGYCIADVVKSNSEGYRVGLLLRDMPLSDLDVQIFQVRDELANVADGSQRYQELMAELRALLGQQTQAP